MMRSRLGLKALELCALVVGVMAVGGGAAQAEVGSHWNVNGSSISSTLLPELKANELEGNGGVLLSELSKKKVELECTGMALQAVKLGAEGKIDTGGRAHFTGCLFRWGGVLQKKCTPHSLKDPEGLIKTEGLHGLIQLHTIEGVNRGTVLILPDVGDLLAWIVLGKEGELNECAAGEKLPVSGKLSLKDCLNKFSTEEVTHLAVENPPLTDMWILNKTAEHKATLDGSAVFALTGAAHTGLKWSGTPG